MQTKPLPTLTIFASAYGVQKKRSMPPLTMVSLSAINMGITPTLPMAPPLLRLITTHRSKVDMYMSAPIPTTQVGNTWPFSFLSSTPTGRRFWKWRVSNSQPLMTSLSRLIRKLPRLLALAAWRFPPHSLASNTFQLLFSIFSTKDILIEGFGAGTSFSAVAGLIALSRSRFRSVLLCLGAVAMHPPTFCTLLRAYTFYYERDLKAHKDFLEEKRPDKNTRPANYTAEHSPVDTSAGSVLINGLWANLGQGRNFFTA